MRDKAGIKKAKFIKLLLSLVIFNSNPLHAEDYTRAVGTIYCDGGTRGTASHISLPQNYHNNLSVILSAAHVLFDKHSGKPYKQCSYLPQNKRLGGIAFETLSAHSYIVESSDKIAQATSDIVFVKLKHRAYQPTLSLLRNDSNRSEKLLLLSISHNNNANFESWECQQLYSKDLPQEQILLHNCPSKAGDSGAPIIDSNSGNIVAIHGGRLNLNSDNKSSKSHIWINQARRTDSSMIKTLEEFLRQP